MRQIRTILAATALAAAVTGTPALADDRGMLVGFLEDNLSSAGRQVTITGFTGALSSRATMQELTVADSEGVWLTLRGVVLDWNRAAVLAGRFSVNELSAEEIIVERAPLPDPNAVPSPEAQGFSLPQLPISVQIGKVDSPHIELGESLVGEPVTASLSGAVALEGGEGRVTLDLERLDDAPKTQFNLNASFANASRRLVVDLVAKEEAGGLVGQKLRLPGQPDFELAIKGDGIVDAFAARMALSTAGEERLAGEVTLMRQNAGGFRFTANVGGNVAPLFLPDYAEFFGPDVRLIATGNTGAEGGVDIDQLALTSQALTLTGVLSVAPDGLPQKFALDATLIHPDGTPVLLPIGGGVPTRVGNATVKLSFDQAVGPDWTARAVVNGFDRPDMGAGLVRLDVTGQIVRGGAEGPAVNGAMSFMASGLRLEDPALAAAVGPTVTGSGNVIWTESSDIVTLEQLSLNGAHYGLSGNATVDGLTTGLRVAGNAEARVRDLSKFSGLAGRPLSGAASVRLTGGGSALAGDFDVKADVAGQDVTIGQAEVDRLLQGASVISVDAARGAAGTEIRALSVQTKGLTASGSGHIATAGSDLVADVSMPDLSVLGPQYRGSFSGKVTASGTPQDGQAVLQVESRDLAMGQAQVDGLLRGKSVIALDLSAKDGRFDLRQADVTNPQITMKATGFVSTTGPSNVVATVDMPNVGVLGPGYRGAFNGKVSVAGTTDDGSLSVTANMRDLAVGQQQADALLRGQSTVALDLAVRNGRIDVDRADIRNPQLRLSATGQLTGETQTVKVDAQLANLAVLLPEFPGALTVNGTVATSAQGMTMDLRGRGPGQIDARVAGTVSPGFKTANLTMAGSAQSALVNGFLGDRAISGPVRFDLRLNGPLAPQSLTGRVSMDNGRFTDPDLAMAIENINATADLAGGRANIAVRARVDAGGSLRVAGTVGMAAPYDANLVTTLERVVIRDPTLYRTRANGEITIKGPLTGGAKISGRIALLETEIQVPTSLASAADIPDDMVHLREPAAVRETRVRAGLVEVAAANASGPSRPFALNLEVSAPNQVFVRGRGLDAELGGNLRLSGTTDAIVPSGGFDLIRGRLDILGKRLTLAQARLRLQGDFDPYLEVIASNTANGFTSMVNIIGNASDPTVSFTSSPELPEEEVLAQLLFGRDLGSLSTLQTLRLAGAVATLAGKGGGGLMSKLRTGAGLDDFDVQTNDAGNTEVTAGKYLSDRTYSELSVDDQGLSEIRLNFDVTDIVTLRARANSDGDTGVGVHIERDY